MKVFVLEHSVNGATIRENGIEGEAGTLGEASGGNGFTVGPVEVQVLRGDIICSLKIQVCSLRKRRGLEIQV